MGALKVEVPLRIPHMQGVFNVAALNKAIVLPFAEIDLLQLSWPFQYTIRLQLIF